MIDNYLDERIENLIHSKLTKPCFIMTPHDIRSKPIKKMLLKSVNN